MISNICLWMECSESALKFQYNIKIWNDIFSKIIWSISIRVLHRCYCINLKNIVLPFEIHIWMWYLRVGKLLKILVFHCQDIFFLPKDFTECVSGKSNEKMYASKNLYEKFV